MKVSEVEPFSGMLAAPNALMITGAPTTVMLALDVLPVPPSVEVTCTLLFFTPAVVPCTLMETTQDALAARVPAEILACPEPETAAAVPPQELVRPLGVATTKPAGRLSVNANPLSATAALGFVTLNVNEVVPFRGIVAAPKTFVIVGGLATVRFAVAVFPLPPLVEVTCPVVFV